MNLVKINAADYGLTENKAKEISDMFKPMLDKMVELEGEYNKVLSLEVNKNTCKIAWELRQKYVKVRTGTAAIHKDLKTFYLQGGRFVDGWKNAQLMAAQDIEKKLMGIENHYENIEKERIALLQDERHSKLLKYVEDEIIIPTSLGSMSDSVWDNYLAGTKVNYDLRIKAEERAEKERLAKEKAEITERKRIVEENERLKKEAVEKERLREIEANKRAKAEAKRQATEEAERKAYMERARKEREVYDAELRKEREARERVVAELKAKKEAEERIESERLAKIEAELSKGDTDRVKDLINDLEGITTKYQFKSKKSRNMYAGVIILVGKIITYIKK